MTAPTMRGHGFGLRVGLPLWLAILVASGGAGCHEKQAATAPPPPLRPEAEPVATTKTVVQKDSSGARRASDVSARSNSPV